MRMPISDETRAALELLKDVRRQVSSSEAGLRGGVQRDLNTLISVLESPVFGSILNIKDSLRELKRQVSLPRLAHPPAFHHRPFQVQLHPSILPADFDITPTGKLVIRVPEEANGTEGRNGFDARQARNQSGHLGEDARDDSATVRSLTFLILFLRCASPTLFLV